MRGTLSRQWHAVASWLLHKGWGLLAPGLAIAAGLLVFLWNPVSIQVLRNAMFDQYQRWQPREPQTAPVKIIDIDDESLKRLGQWPWPRNRIAELTTRLQQAQAAAIAFDILFSEPDRTSPQAMLDLWNVPMPIREQLSRLPDPDAALADAFSHGKVVLGFALDSPVPTDGTAIAAGQGAILAMPLQKARQIALGESAQPYVHGFTHITSALPILQTQADGNGALVFVPDSDGVIRRVPLLVRAGNVLLPTLMTEALRVTQGAQTYTTRTAPSHGVGLQEIRIGQLIIPTTPQGEVWVHYAKPQPQRYLSAWKVLAGEVSLDDLKGHIVLVGASAQGLMDLRFSPLGGALPGVEIHAQLLEQILTGSGLRRPSWASAIEGLAIVAGGALAGGAALALGALVSFGIFAGLLAMLWALAWWSFSAQGLLLDAVLPSLVLALAFVLSSIVHHLAAERRQRWIKEAFSRYVSPNLVAHLLRHPQSLELGGKRQVCSFVFTDLAGFTSLMEQMDPAAAVSLLNAYLDQMISIAFAHHGTLDRIVGDAVAIMFSAPVVQTDHQRRALDCALAMQRFATRYAADLKAQGTAFCQTRIGVHSGEVIVGNFGGTAMFDYRALGDAVNTASRLEGANKQLGTLVCVSQAILDGCPDAPARPIGRVLLQGKMQPIMVFEPLDPSPAKPGIASDAASLKAYRSAFDLMSRGEPGATAAFERLADRLPLDALVAMHLARLRAGARDDLIVLAHK